MNRLAYLALPLTRVECPGWGRLYRWLGIHDSHRWQDAPIRTIRGKAHGFLMKLHLPDWAERMTYFLGRYYDLPLEVLLRSTLNAGDRVVDVGGNIGMVTLLLARNVGPKGLVQTFEPNPECCSRLREMLALNPIDWVTVYPLGLSDAASTERLAILHDHSGVGTLGALSPEEELAITSTTEVAVARGDDILLEDHRPIKLMKIDVEGYEVKALKGMTLSLERDHPLVVLETIDGHLRRAGSSAEELFELMQSRGYEAYAMTLARRLGRYDLRLRPVARVADLATETDTVWIHPTLSPPHDRLLGFIGR